MAHATRPAVHHPGQATALRRCGGSTLGSSLLKDDLDLTPGFRAFDAPSTLPVLGRGVNKTEVTITVPGGAQWRCTKHRTRVHYTELAKNTHHSLGRLGVGAYDHAEFTMDGGGSGFACGGRGRQVFVEKSRVSCFDGKGQVGKKRENGEVVVGGREVNH